MSYMGGVDPDEREMYQTLLHHFALKLQEERARSAALRQQLECANERISLFEMTAYGLC